VTVEEPQTLAAPSSRQSRKAKELLQDVFGTDKNPCRLVYGVAKPFTRGRVGLDVVFEVGAQGCGEQCSFSLQAAVSPNSV
jgi:hypothetical protein